MHPLCSLNANNKLSPKAAPNTPIFYLPQTTTPTPQAKYPPTTAPRYPQSPLTSQNLLLSTILNAVTTVHPSPNTTIATPLPSFESPSPLLFLLKHHPTALPTPVNTLLPYPASVASHTVPKRK